MVEQKKLEIKCIEESKNSFTLPVPPLPQGGTAQIQETQPRPAISPTEQILANRGRLKTEIILDILLACNGMKLEMSNRKKNRKIHKYTEIKKHSSEQPLGQRSSQNGNFKNVLK